MDDPLSQEVTETEQDAEEVVVADPVKKKVKILEAKYSDEADSIIILGECEEGQLQHQIHSNCFEFGDKDKVVEMKKTADLMIGKTINMVFDPGLDERIKANKALDY